MKYLATFVSGGALDTADGGDFFNNFIGFDNGSVLNTMLDFSSHDPVVPALVIATSAVVIFGVEKGIEKQSRIMMPVLAILSIVVAVYSLTIPGALTV